MSSIKRIKKSDELYNQSLDASTLAECKKMLIKAINLNPKNFDALVDLTDFEQNHNKAIAQYEKVIGIYQQLLELNPGDNQGIRYVLLTLFLELECYDDFKQLDKDCIDDDMTTFGFSRALYSFIKHGQTDESDQLLSQAHIRNEFVIDYLFLTKNQKKI